MPAARAAVGVVGRPRRSGRGRAWLWPAACGAVAALIALPILSVLWSLSTPAWGIWAHLWRTQLVGLLANTVGLVLGVALGTCLLGAGLAWLVVGYEFPGRRAFEWALVLPLALPAYVMGFVVVGALEFAGPLQTALRAALGPGVRLPDPRAGWGVTLVMTLVFYPYVYTLARAAFAEQAPELLESARALGRRRRQVLLEVVLPLARPALVAGTTLACMEALADFGTVATFGYRTLTEAIYRVWHGMFDRGAATQLAAILLATAAGLILLERLSRGRARYTHGRRLPRPPARVVLHGGRAAAAAAACAAVLAVGFGLPVLQLVVWAAGALARDGLPAGIGTAGWASLGLASAAALLTGAVAVFLGYAARIAPSRPVRMAVRIAGLGYAIPGAVVAVGVLLPLAWLDRHLASLLARLTGAEPGLLLVGSAAGLLFAYLVRFLAVASQTVEASLSRIPPSLDEAAKSLGVRGGRALRAIHAPLMRRGLVAALALVFIDVMKELPATLLLRPFGLDTLAIVIWQRTAESQWPEAALPALVLVLAGLLPVALVLRAVGEREPGNR